MDLIEGLHIFYDILSDNILQLVERLLPFSLFISTVIYQNIDGIDGKVCQIIDELIFREYKMTIYSNVLMDSFYHVVSLESNREICSLCPCRNFIIPSNIIGNLKTVVVFISY
jgi:hypothetical protein